MCNAPWSRNCPNTDYVVALFWRGKRRDICRRCWNKCPKNLEWGKGARKRKEVKKELESCKIVEVKEEIIVMKKKSFDDYIPFGKHAWVHKDALKDEE